MTKWLIILAAGILIWVLAARLDTIFNGADLLGAILTGVAGWRVFTLTTKESK